MSTHIEFQQWATAPLERVFLFFADPRNLPRIMPPASGTRLVELRLKLVPAGGMGKSTSETLAGVGSEIVTSFRLLPFLPFRARWTALITEFQWDHHFADIQKEGPFKSFHHRHEFAAETRGGTNGTIVKDVIDYEVGFGFPGELAGRSFVLRQLRSTFAYRQQALAKLLG